MFGHSSRDQLRAGNTGVERRELGSVAGGEGRQVSIGGVLRAFHVGRQRGRSQIIG